MSVKLCIMLCVRERLVPGAIFQCASRIWRKYRRLWTLWVGKHYQRKLKHWQKINSHVFM
jgi:hypothetical protein